MVLVAEEHSKRTNQTNNLEYVSFFFNDTATTEIYTLSLHDALPISKAICNASMACGQMLMLQPVMTGAAGNAGDRKSTRLNSSHLVISYAVFCLKKKKRVNDLYHTQPATSA